MFWLASGKDFVIKSIMVNDKLTAKSTEQLWAKEKVAKVGVGAYMWWTAISCSQDS